MNESKGLNPSKSGGFSLIWTALLRACPYDLAEPRKYVMLEIASPTAIATFSRHLAWRSGARRVL